MPRLRNYYLKIVDEWLLELLRKAGFFFEVVQQSKNICSFVMPLVRLKHAPRSEEAFFIKNREKATKSGKSLDSQFSIAGKFFSNLVYIKNLFSIHLERENIFGRHISTERSVVS